LGVSVARSLWDEFPTDENTWVIDTQFMWGSSVLISPVVDEVISQLTHQLKVVIKGATTKDVYFPDARWFDISKWVTDDVIQVETSRRNYVTKG